MHKNVHFWSAQTVRLWVQNWIQTYGCVQLYVYVHVCVCVCVCICMLLCPFVIVLTLLQEEFRPVKPISPSVLIVAELIFETNNLFLFLETSK